MSRRLILLLSILGFLILILWQLPNLLKALPSRYVAAYFPEEVQALAVRDHVELLPTAKAVPDANSLLDRNAKNNPDSSNKELLSTPEENVKQKQTATRPPAKLVTPPSQTAGPTRTPEPTATATLIPYPNSGRIGPIRHHFQTWNNCGPATLAMALSFFEIYVSQEQTAMGLKPDPEDRNVSPYEMAAFVNRETELSAIDRANGDLDTLRRLVSNNMPVIIELGLDPPGEYSWMGWYGHYLLVVAYDDAEQSIWVYDSWFGTSEQPGANADDQGRQISYSDLDTYWRQFNRNYILLYQSNDEDLVRQILGSQVDDDVMWQAALNQAQQELAAEEGNPFLWFNLGTSYVALGNYDEAAAAFDQARAIGLPWRMLWYQFGPYEAYYELGRFEDVMLLANVTLMDRPYFEESYYFRGLAEEALGDTDAARKDLEKAARFNPLFTPASEALSRIDIN